jgi:hypothetical protein
MILMILMILMIQSFLFKSFKILKINFLSSLINSFKFKIMSSTIPPFKGELTGTDETGVHHVGCGPPKDGRKGHGRHDGPPTGYPNLEDTGNMENTGNTGNMGNMDNMGNMGNNSKNYTYFIIVLVIIIVILPLVIFMIYSRPLQHYLPMTRKPLQGRKKQVFSGNFTR